MGVGGQRHAPAALPPGNRPGTLRIGGSVGPRAGLGGCGKSRPPPGFDHRTVQPVGSRYTNYAIPAHKNIFVNVFSLKHKKRYAKTHAAFRIISWAEHIILSVFLDSDVR
jgi:hypothetical protein